MNTFIISSRCFHLSSAETVIAQFCAAEVESAQLISRIFLFHSPSRRKFKSNFKQKSIIDHLVIMSGRRKSARQGTTSERQKRQKTQDDATEVVQLSESAPNPGLRPGPGTCKANEKGPTHTQPLAKRPSIIDFETIFRESWMIPTSSPHLAFLVLNRLNLGQRKVVKSLRPHLMGLWSRQPI